MSESLSGKLRALAQIDARQGVARGGTASVSAATKAGSGKAKASGSGDRSQSAVSTEEPAADGRPTVESFDYEVEPHVPLRSRNGSQLAVTPIAPAPPMILSIVPEGTRVKKGEVVCEIDSSAFQDALQIQKIRHEQASAWVAQARSILEAELIAERAYEHGIYPQDVAQVQGYIEICTTRRDQAARTLAWARATRAKGYRTASQVAADAAAFEQTEIALEDARGMLDRLTRFTGMKIIKALHAKSAAIRADLLSLQSALELETERLERIKTIIAHCSMKAPRDGIVVYANRSNGWGRLETQIHEGLTVYQSQPIFRLLDPTRMRVRATINEAQIALVRSGQPALIHLEAFPDRTLRGSVAEIVPIPGLVNGPFSDVHTFYATVKIESGAFPELRSGLSAEVEFLVENRHRVTRIPLESIRWVGERPFAALSVETDAGSLWHWQPIALGATDTNFAEVVSGLEPGDRIVAHTDLLPAAEIEDHEIDAPVNVALDAR